MNSEAPPDGTDAEQDAASCGAAFAAVKKNVVERVRAEVSDRDWRLFWRVVVDGQSAVDVGKEYGVSANAVRLVKMRILRRMREVWSEVKAGAEY